MGGHRYDGCPMAGLQSYRTRQLLVLGGEPGSASSHHKVPGLQSALHEQAARLTACNAASNIHLCCDISSSYVVWDAVGPSAAIFLTWSIDAMLDAHCIDACCIFAYWFIF